MMYLIELNTLWIFDRIKTLILNQFPYIETIIKKIS